MFVFVYAYMDTKNIVPDDLLWFPEMVNQLTHRGVTLHQITELFQAEYGNEWNRRVEKLMNSLIDEMPSTDMKTKLEKLRPKSTIIVHVSDIRQPVYEQIFTDDYVAAQFVYYRLHAFTHKYTDPPKTVDECHKKIQSLVVNSDMVYTVYKCSDACCTLWITRLK